MLFGVHIYGNTTTIILYDDGVVFADGHFDVGTIASQCFVDRVVHCLVYEVVETLLADVADVHGWTFAHGFEAFEHRDVTGAIACRAFLFCIFH